MMIKFAFIPKVSLIVCALLSAAAYGQVKVPMSSVTAPSVMAPAASEPNGVVKKAFLNVASARSYRAHLEIDGLGDSPGGGSIDCNVDYVAPNRVHMVGDVGDLSGLTGTLRFEAIVIGKDQYINRGGTWTNSTNLNPELANLSDFFMNFDTRDVDEMFNHTGTNQIKFELVGPDLIDKEPVAEYEIATVNPQGRPLIFRAWIGMSDNLLYKAELKIESDQDRKLPEVKLRATFRDYNADIKVERPV